MVITPDNVCCNRILVKMDAGVLRDVVFEGGCDGNGKALGRLLEGMPVARAMELLKGVDCEGKGTSCADQLARGLEENLKPVPEMDA
ncbi:MAG: TIGR03905 family TSCPD domain-containing protein [Planctomycetota bacterium]|nr:TIGR03905 family TSCPD domain-containing protein [Planctomycetota bacterium]